MRAPKVESREDGGRNELGVVTDLCLLGPIPPQIVIHILALLTHVLAWLQNMASQTFANTGESAIEQSLEIKAANTPNPGTKDFEKFYEIDRTSHEIENGDYKRVSTFNLK